MATEEEGHTILLIERAGNTGDVKDIQFTVSWRLNDIEKQFQWQYTTASKSDNSVVITAFKTELGKNPNVSLLQKPIRKTLTFLPYCAKYW